MTKLHQVIPAVDEVAKTAQNRLTEIHKLLSKEALTSGHHRSYQPDNGEVRDAILQAFADSGGPLSVEEVRAAVSIQLGAVVAASSVRSYLNINAEPGQTFERVGRGIYRLRK